MGFFINKFILLFVCSLFLCGSLTVHAIQEGTQVLPVSQEMTFSLYKKNTEENVKFEAVNMFPGDVLTQYYRVAVSYQDTVTVKCSAVVRTGYEKLGEVLQLRVRLLHTEDTLYEGCINEMPESLEYILRTDTGEKIEELCYEVKAYLNTDVGNEYQNQKLLADFSWWVEEEENLESKPVGGVNVIPGYLPRTSDDTKILLWMGLLLIAVLAVIVLLAIWKRRLFAGIVMFLGLIGCLCITTLALTINLLKVNDNLFETGEVSINLNDGKPVIQEDEFIFEPGMTVQKSFFLENNGICEVYYKIYFSNIEGELADVLDVTIDTQKGALYQGKLSELTKEFTEVSDETLQMGERLDFTATFHFPKTEGNNVQSMETFFDICADAVQTVNNLHRAFD